MAKKFKFTAALEKARMKHLVEVKREIKGVGITRGFVVDFSDSLVLFHVLDADAFCLNGYTVIREADISQHRVFDKQTYWQAKAAKQFQLKPVKPGAISLASFPELLTSIAKHYPLITLHPERKKPDVCYIGELVSTTERTFTIEDLNCNAEWSGPRRMKFDDITRVDFDGGYEKALAITAPKRRSRRK